MSCFAIHCNVSGRIIEVLGGDAGIFGGQAARRMLSGYVAPGGAAHLVHLLDLVKKQGAVSEWLIDLQGDSQGVGGTSSFCLWAAARQDGDAPGDLLILGAPDADLDGALAVMPLNGALAPLVAAIRSRAADPAAVAADLRVQVRGLKAQVQPPPTLEHRLLGMAAHDLRNPLLVLSMGCSYLLHDGKELSDEHRSMLNESLDTCEFMNRMVDGMVALAQVATGTPALSREATDLAELMERAIRRHTPVARERNITMELVELAPVVAEVDPMRIAQMVDQLLSNALTHCPAGTTVRVGLTREGGEVMLVVQDDGPGIVPEIEDVLFRPFGKPHGALDPRRYGAGVGLAIVRYIVESHDGCIDVETAPGKGSRFTVTLPVDLTA